MLAGEIYGLLDVGGAGTARDDRRLLVERRVPDASRAIVIGAAREHHFPAQARSECLDGGAWYRDLSPGEALGLQVADPFEYGREAAQRPGRRERQARTYELTSSHGCPRFVDRSRFASRGYADDLRACQIRSSGDIASTLVRGAVE